MSKPIDLRSDTVTLPTAAMRAAMAAADVGDDVYGEDPTVTRLEAAAADRVGKEAAVFVPSGTMANQIAIRLHTHHGDTVLASQGAHILLYEAGGAAALSGVQVRTIGEGGLFGAADVRAALPIDDIHVSRATLLAAENTHNTGGGRVVPQDALVAAADLAHEAGLAVHLDGARLFNASVASRTSAEVLAAPFDTVAFCFSKGLGAPLGSVLCGSRDAIAQARRLRKMLGGGMRQAGIVAAGALHALVHHVERLADDHANAARLADGLAGIGLAVSPAPETNLVMFEVEAARARAFARGMRERSLLINPISPTRFRAVTHLDVGEKDIDVALERIEAAVAG